MTPDDEKSIDALARAIGEGTRVDWASTESAAADDSLRQVIRELSVIAAISDVHAAPSLTSDSADSSATTPADAPATWGSFRLLGKIGHGAFGEVYRAWDTRLDREVALKLLPADSLGEASRATTIIEEGRLLARVRHPNVVTIYGAERIDNRVGLWMEFVRGRTLEQVVTDAGPLSPSDVIAIGSELCRAVSAVHAAGLLHRDIKAQNVMRSDDGRIALMDFGAGQTLDDEASLELAGTPLYLAPEVLHGEPATVRSDIYSLGVLMYHLITGTYPVRARTVREIRQAHERGDRTSVQAARRGVSPKLAQLIERAIDPSPLRRFASVDALGATLTGLRPRARMQRFVALGAIAAALVLTVGLSWDRWIVPSFLRASPVEPVIAVLPFRNLSTEPDTEWFVDGLTEDIIQDLATVQGLQVRSSGSSFALKGQPRSLPDIARRLGVNFVVEGSAIRDGTKLRITAQLLEITGDVPLWFEQYDGELKDVFTVRDEVSRAIVTRLSLTLGNDRRRHQTNLDAYDSYLRGRALVDRRGIANMQKAAGFFERAVALDPSFAQAHAGLANAYALMSFPYRGMAYATAYPIMRPAAVQALRLDPQLAEAHVAMGWVYAFERDWPNAERSFQQAIRLNPSLTPAYTNYCISTLQVLRKFDEALRLLGDAASHDPLSLDLQREVGEVLLFSGRFAEAVDAFQRIRQVDPDFPFVQVYLAMALTFAGRPEEALTFWQPGVIWPVAAYVKLGRRADAERLAADHAAYPFRVALTAASLGDTERAIDAVEKVAVNEPHRIGRLMIHPELASLRDHPRLVVLRKKFGLP